MKGREHLWVSVLRILRALTEDIVDSRVAIGELVTTCGVLLQILHACLGSVVNYASTNSVCPENALPMASWRSFTFFMTSKACLTMDRSVSVRRVKRGLAEAPGHHPRDSCQLRSLLARAVLILVLTSRLLVLGSVRVLHGGVPAPADARQGSFRPSVPRNRSAMSSTDTGFAATRSRAT